MTIQVLKGISPVVMLTEKVCVYRSFISYKNLPTYRICGYHWALTAKGVGHERVLQEIAPPTNGYAQARPFLMQH